MSFFGEVVEVGSLPLEEQYRFYRDQLGMSDGQARLAVAFANGLMTVTGDVVVLENTEDWLEREEAPDSLQKLQAAS